MWKEAIDLDLLVTEQEGKGELLASVALKSKVPHNVPDG
jgi:hypothetical protein